VAGCDEGRIELSEEGAEVDLVLSGPGGVEGTATELGVAIRVKALALVDDRVVPGYSQSRSMPVNWPSSASLMEESMKNLRSACFLAISWKVSVPKDQPPMERIILAVEPWDWIASYISL
jgi:hypothetical protein